MPEIFVKPRKYYILKKGTITFMSRILVCKTYVATALNRYANSESTCEKV